MLTIRGRLITPFYSGVRVCWSEHSDSSFVYGFMSLDYGLGTMATTTFYGTVKFLSLVSVAILEECRMASADMQ